MPSVLITGANRGLGLEFARQYALGGWTVLATCRAPEKATALKALAAAHPELTILSLDVTDDNAVAALGQKLKDTPLDLLINNAGILTAGPKAYNAAEDDPDQRFGSAKAESWARILRVNTIAPVMIAQALLPALRRGQQKKIVMVSSGWGSIGEMGPQFAAYRASKAALNSAMRNMALLLKPEGLIVISLCPGWVSTDMGGASAGLTPEQSVTASRRLIEALSTDQGGLSLRYTGEVVPW